MTAELQENGRLALKLSKRLSHFLKNTFVLDDMFQGQEEVARQVGSQRGPKSGHAGQASPAQSP